MSPSPNDEPRTPERKASTTLLNAFKTLTGSRPKLENRSTSPATSVAPVQASLARPYSSIDGTVLAQATQADAERRVSNGHDQGNHKRRMGEKFVFDREIVG
ncbi:hypothetical protein LTS18_001838, partial [Coniosporium uncinatum]